MTDRTAKTYFLTGSSRGLGRSLAQAVLEAGHQLIATARRPEQLHDLIESFGDRVLALPLDVTDYAGAKDAVSKGLARFGRIDVFINNAGQATVGSVEDLSVDDFSDQVTINYLGTVNVVKAALPLLRAQGNGRIILVSSVGDRIATAGASAYFASKWAIAGFTDSLALEVAPLGIRVTAVEPGGMKTDFATEQSSKLVPNQAAYDSTVGATIRALTAPDYLDSYSDPATIAKVILKVSDLDDPPIRLLIGSRWLQYGSSFDQQRAEADKEWSWLSALGD